MPRQPVRFDFDGEFLPTQAEAAARRRLGILENTFPAVREWEVAARSRPAAASGYHAEAHVTATILGGDRFHVRATGTDVLGALRLAFNAVEARLHEESDDARQRAFHWFEKVKRRTGRSWLNAE
jgi:hypothetical protein